MTTTPSSPLNPRLPQQLAPVALADVLDAAEADSNLIEVESQSGVTVRGLALKTTRLKDVELSSGSFKTAFIADCAFEGCLLFASDFDSSGIKRASFKGGTSSGVVFSAAAMADVTFTGVKLNMANFRVASLRRVAFIDCDLSEADFQGATLGSVTFRNCELNRASFAGASMMNVDLRGSDVTRLLGLAGLKGASMSPQQIMSLAPAMAHELGILIRD